MFTGQRDNQAGVTKATLSLAALMATLSLVASALPVHAESAGDSPDMIIMSDLRELTVEEIRAADVTDSRLGAASLDEVRARRDSIDVDRRVHRVFLFGDQKVIVDAATPLVVLVGRNAAGDVVHEIVPRAMPVPVAAQAGYAVPPTSAWKYNNDGDLQQSIGSWYRDMWWTIMKANDYRACTSCPANDYWRMYGKLRASTVTGTGPNDGFRRAWLEFDRFDDWTSPGSFEPGQPEESYGGSGTQTTTIGFKTGVTVTLGIAPLTASGTLEDSYSGSMTRSTENWHPIIRPEIGSGGVQWCRYDVNEFTGSKLITTRVSARTTSTGTGIGWYILMGQQEGLSRCPSQL